jgi:hypothetical protein
MLAPGQLLRPPSVPDEWTRKFAGLEWEGRAVSLGDLERRKLSRPVRRTLVLMGIVGHLSTLLNASVGKALLRVFKRGGWMALGFFLAGQTSEDLPGLARLGLPSKPLQLAEDLANRALWEVTFFTNAGCNISWCDHAKHWFVSEDRRRIDCIFHRVAGQKARYRRSPARRRRPALKRTSKD